MFLAVSILFVEEKDWRLGRPLHLIDKTQKELERIRICNEAKLSLRVNPALQMVLPA